MFRCKCSTHGCIWRSVLTIGSQKFRREVIAWRHLRHPNILPFIGVNLERHKLAMVSEWMDHGNINEFVENYTGVNRAQLVSDYAISRESDVTDSASCSMPRMGWNTCIAFTWCTET
jgi:serine/threonine protein kinase